MSEMMPVKKTAKKTAKKTSKKTSTKIELAPTVAPTATTTGITNITADEAAKNAPVYNSKFNELRIYANNKMTFTASNLGCKDTLFYTNFQTFTTLFLFELTYIRIRAGNSSEFSALCLNYLIGQIAYQSIQTHKITPQ